MILEKVYARFYKSFNFDHIRKAHRDAKPNPWEEELLDGAWYPYIEIPIDKRITAVVGANESGKSHLLSAIEKSITGMGMEQRDLCRYSPFFNVEKGKACWPHLGVSWTHVTKEECEAIKTAAGAKALDDFDFFAMFRESPDEMTLYLPNKDETYGRYKIKERGNNKLVRDCLPIPFRIKPDIALPNSIPLAWIVNPTKSNQRLMSRGLRSTFIQAGAAVADLVRSRNTSPQADQLLSTITPYLPRLSDNTEDTSESSIVEGLDLARQLLLSLANVDPQKLVDLSKSIEAGEDGHVNALMSGINHQLEKMINFPKWWVQDREFSLQLTLRELDLVFTVKDRTGTEYTFAERSSGLKYFLSYLIQSRVHERPQGRSEILLMDEPDTYLSAEAQQDLLKIFSAFANPENGVRPVQVVYVTHSPFLLDKNHADRIRVLQKGKWREGTKVIRNASKNHYEPLRSAFGAFVGETAFVGACNLLVEGAADQVILSGISRVIKNSTTSADQDSIDLNKVVIVPCGSASQVPYMLYLIRGRDTDKPPVVALLDSDPAGNEAATIMRRDRKLSRLIKSELILQLAGANIFEGAAPQNVEMEDILPLELGVHIANKCIADTTKFREESPEPLTVDEVRAKATEQNGLFDRINSALKEKGGHIEKILFARILVEECERKDAPPAIAQFIVLYIERMKRLFKEINTAKRRAEREVLQEKIGTVVRQHSQIFLRDHPNPVTRERASTLLLEIEETLDESTESRAVKNETISISRDFKLDEDITELVTDYAGFRDRVDALHNAFHIAQLAIDEN